MTLPLLRPLRTRALGLLWAGMATSAIGDELFRDGEAQPLRSACDDRDLTGQQRHLITLSLKAHRIANIIFHI